MRHPLQWFLTGILEVVADRKAKLHYPVTVATVAGTEIDKEIAALKQRKRRYTRIEGLVLFSLNPAKLYEAAQKGNGQRVPVKEPVQLILYGKSEE